MAPQSNRDPLPPGPDNSAVDSPSADDLLALIPDMELLETSAVDARTAHSAFAASVGSSRKPGVTPKLSDQTTAITARLAPAAVSTISSDDPYADQMPELEASEVLESLARTVPAVQAMQTATTPRPAPSRAVPITAAAQPQVAARPKVTAPPPARHPAIPPQAEQRAARREAPSGKSTKLPPPEGVVVPPVMDREFIVRNRIVELYLSGSLPVRGATVFERFCRENPQILDEIGLPERVHASLRLLEASGKPEPWQEKPRQFWERPYVPAILAGLVLILGIGLLMVNSRLSVQTHKAAALQQLVADQPLDAAADTSSIDIQPTHVGPDAAIAVTIGGSTAQLVNIRIDLTHSAFRAFRVTIDRVNQGRVAVLNNLIKDSNGELGFSLNTSALGPGGYQLTIEGLDWRGNPQPDSWAAINIRH